MSIVSNRLKHWEFLLSLSIIAIITMPNEREEGIVGGWLIIGKA